MGASVARSKGRRIRSGIAIEPRGQTIFTHPKVSPKITNAEATEQVSALVLGFSSGTLAKAAGRSKDSAKHWKIGHACPNLASAINLARSIPSVRAWLMEQIGEGAHPQSEFIISEIDRRVALAMRRNEGG